MAKVNSFRKQAGGTDEEMRAQSNSETVFNSLRNIAILDGTYLENISVGTAETLVPHKLSRTFRGYVICSNNTLCFVANSNGTFDKTLFIGLKASSACVVNLWVF